MIPPKLRKQGTFVRPNHGKYGTIIVLTDGEPDDSTYPEVSGVVVADINAEEGGPSRVGEYLECMSPMDYYAVEIGPIVVATTLG